MKSAILGFCMLATGATLVTSVQADPLARGREVYEGTCIACHGGDGSGVLPGVPDLTAKDGPLRNSDAVLIERITDGFQSPGAIMAMPAKGGDPNLTADDVRAVLQYMRAEFGS